MLKDAELSPLVSAAQPAASAASTAANPGGTAAASGWAVAAGPSRPPPALSLPSPAQPQTSFKIILIIVQISAIIANNFIGRA